MRSTPSFLGGFCAGKSKDSSARRPHGELPIEREAVLREKKKKILQRLKKNVGELSDGIENPLQSHPTAQTGDDVDHPGKVIFSPQTSKRFLRQHLVDSSPGNEIKRLDISHRAVPQLAEERYRDAGKQSRGARERTRLPRDREHEGTSTYVPSFSEKPPRSFQESYASTLKKNTSKIPTPTESTNKSFNSKSSSYSGEKQVNNSRENLQRKFEVPIIRTEKEDTFIVERQGSLGWSDDEDATSESSPFRRSASFHSMKDKIQAERRKIRTSAGRRQYLNVSGGVEKTLSLPSIQNAISSSSSGSEPGFPSNFAKTQQDKLEKEFQRVEEDLDHALTELRKYLRTS